jgi:hypothetical protein
MQLVLCVKLSYLGGIYIELAIISGQTKDTSGSCLELILSKLAAVAQKLSVIL